MKILIGADPELFLTKDNNFVSAFGMIKGTKENPFKVENGAVQVDGMALEFNIKPAKNSDEFSYNVNSVMSQLRNMIPNEFEFSKKPLASFSKSYMSMQPKEALLLGCSPDYNAYIQEMNPSKIGYDTPKRVAGGHIHIGWTENEDPFEYGHFSSCSQLAIQLDYALGVPSILLDKDTERVKYCGNAGSFRPKPYGLEYRVLSNFWIYNEQYTAFVCEKARRALTDIAENNMTYRNYFEGNSENIINKKLTHHAREMLISANYLLEGYNDMFNM